jgi:hypothetical protein
MRIISLDLELPLIYYVLHLIALPTRKSSAKAKETVPIIICHIIIFSKI